MSLQLLQQVCLADLIWSDSVSVEKAQDVAESLEASIPGVTGGTPEVEPEVQVPPKEEVQQQDEEPELQVEMGDEEEEAEEEEGEEEEDSESVRVQTSQSRTFIDHIVGHWNHYGASSPLAGPSVSQWRVTILWTH